MATWNVLNAPRQRRNQQHAVIILLKHLEHNASSLAASKTPVRTVGRLVSVDSKGNICMIAYHHCRIGVRTNALRHERIGSLIEVYGWIVDAEQMNACLETAPCPGRWILDARLVRNVDGLDVALYEQALLIREDFLREHSQMLGTSTVGGCWDDDQEDRGRSLTRYA